MGHRGAQSVNPLHHITDTIAQTKPQTPIVPMTYETKYGIINTEDYDYERARDMGSKDPILELQTILQDPSQYPEALLEKICLNPEALHFVYEYPSKKGTAPADSIGKPILVNNKIPLLLQFDQAWGYDIYGDAELATSGCGPTVLSMAYCGLTGDTSMTPAKIGDLSEKAGYYTAEGTSWTMMSQGAKKLGLKSSQIKLGQNNFKKELDKGHIIVCSVKPGDFTQLGHFILIVGQTKDGLLMINDPNSLKRSSTLWTYDVVLPQVKAAWSVSKA